MYETDQFKLTERDNLETSKQQPQNKNKNLVDKMKSSTSSNFHTRTYRFKNIWKGHYYENIEVEYYSSGQVGTKARHAISGDFTSYTIWKKEENKLFKVVIGNGTHVGGSVHLYYYSPEEYENHHFITLNPTTKSKWYEKQVEIKQNTTI